MQLEPVESRVTALVGDRDQNMELAVRRPSAPVVGEGYRLMEAWLTDHFAKRNMPPPVAPEAALMLLNALRGIAMPGIDPLRSP